MKVINTSGKRKRAIAKATLREGKGTITINKTNLELYNNELYRMRIMEPIILTGDLFKKVSVSIKVKGGGIKGQADAARLALSKALVAYDKSVEKTLLDYDRRLLVADVRRKETAKPNRHGKARAKRQKSYR
jgi:small subunit ribosomal protein S9